MTATAEHFYQAVPGDELRFLIGVDGGGTRTRARLTDRDGRLLGEAESGPSGLGQGTDQALANTSEAITAAFGVAGLPLPPGYVCAVGMGLAGAGIRARAEEFMRRAHMYGALRLDSDAWTALAGAHRGGPGAILIAGTGSVGLARHADGRRVIVGGWGFPVGDEGAGAWLGLHAVRIAHHALDGRAAPGALARAIFEAIGDRKDALLAFGATANQASYARLATLVFDCADADAQAAALLDAAAAALHALVRALDAEGALPLAVLGSVGTRLQAHLPDDTRARCVTPADDAVAGALLLLRQALPDLPAAKESPT